MTSQKEAHLTQEWRDLIASAMNTLLECYRIDFYAWKVRDLIELAT